MSPVRRVVNFVCALALTLAGGAGCAFLLFFFNGWRGYPIIAVPPILLFAGLYWLWADFVNATPNDELVQRQQADPQEAERRQRADHEQRARERSPMPQAEIKPWWSVLEVSPDASADEIRRSYRRKMQQTHPDRVTGLDPEFVELAEKRTKALNAAYTEAMRSRVLVSHLLGL
jgi:hypothetical protein